MTRTRPRLPRLLDALFDLLLRPRARRIRRWSFLVTIPGGIVLAHRIGLRPTLGTGLGAAIAGAALELGLVAAVAVAARRGIGAERLEALLDLVAHPLARRALRTELDMVSVVPRALLRRRRRRPGLEFGYDRGSFELGFAVALVPAIVAESVLVHLLVPDPRARLALAALTVYGLLWLLAMGLAPRVFPHRLRAGALEVRLGVLYSATVPLEAIGAVEHGRERFERPLGLVVGPDGAARLVADHRVDLRLALERPVAVRRPFAEPLATSSISIAVDRPDELARAIAAHRASAAPGPPVGSAGTSARSRPPARRPPARAGQEADALAG